MDLDSRFGNILRLFDDEPAEKLKSRYRDLLLTNRLVRRALPDGRSFLQVEKTFAVVKDINVKERTVDVVASSSQVDWYGDTINPDGWDVKAAFEANPVVLIDHDYSVAAIVGRTVKTWTEGAEFWHRDKFDPPGKNEAADMAFQKIENGSLRATSVGFIPTKWTDRIDEENDDKFLGFAFEEQVLLEKSWVAVPANPGATIPIDQTAPPQDGLTVASQDEEERRLMEDMLLRLHYTRSELRR